MINDVRNTITVDCGTIGVSEVSTWDAGYSMDELAPGTDILPGQDQVHGCDFRGHAATECMIDVPHDTVTIKSPNSDGHTRSQRHYTSPGRPNQLAPQHATEIMIQNYEYQRTPARAMGHGLSMAVSRGWGYGTVDLGPDLDLFRSLPRVRRWRPGS